MNQIALTRLLAAVNRLRILFPDVHMKTFIIFGTNPRHPGAIGVRWEGIEAWHEDAEVAVDRLISAVDGIRSFEKMRAQPGEMTKERTK